LPDDAAEWWYGTGRQSGAHRSIVAELLIDVDAARARHATAQSR